MSKDDLQLFSEDSERAVLSILLKHPEKFNEVEGQLKPFSFSSIPNRVIFSTMEQLHEDNLVTDATMVVEHLKSRGKLDDAGSIDYIEFLTKEPYNKQNFKEFVRIVNNSYKSRSLINVSSKIPDMLKTTDDIGGLLTYIKDFITELIASTGGERTKAIRDAISTHWKEIIERVKNPGIHGKPIGFSSIDSLINGGEPGDLIIVAARPSMGKTAWMLSSALKSGASSLLISREMNTTILLDRLISIHSQVPLMDIRQGTMNQDEVDRVAETVEVLSELPICIDTNYSGDLQYYINTIRRYHSTHEVKFVYVDYIQLIAERDGEATHELGRISKALKSVAEDLGITVFLFSQLNRQVELRDNKRPILSDIRQSGNLEEDADIVIFLYRDEYYYPDTDQPNVIENIIRKNRNGPVGTVKLRFIPETITITDNVRKEIAE